MTPPKGKPVKSPAPRSRKAKPKFGAGAPAASSTRVGWVYRSDGDTTATPAAPTTPVSAPVEAAAPVVPAAIVTPPTPVTAPPALIAAAPEPARARPQALAPVSQPTRTPAARSLAATSADIVLMPVSLSLMMIMAPLSWLSGGRRRP